MQINKSTSRGESSHSQAIKELWKTKWSLQIPHRVRIFAWRVCLNILPTASNLIRKQIKVSIGCGFCDAGAKDLNHILLRRPALVDYWTKFLPQLSQVDRNQNLFDVIMQIKRVSSKEDMGLFFTIASSIWMCINKKLFEDESLNMSSTIDHAILMLHLFKGVKNQSGSALNKFCAWKTPPAGFLKLNVDGAIFHHLHKAGVGSVLRDQEGKVLMAASKGEREVADPETIEFLAVLRGLQFVLSTGISYLVLESDCLLVVSQLNDAESITLSPWGSIISDI
ncbi:unnamed protein product [Fraxinus pennsylvanica]|uniref:Reverse transcriptase zinc-binding domain-containing protein n=1 Tax=Fraxinus pennsylvanica TaxID=56036 RepID=A0AAD2E8Q2_9LAMI|nr:unnamed protein product [Fraxinus pennsylvanica]